MKGNAISICLILCSAIIFPFGGQPQAQLSEAEANACAERITFDVAKGDEWLTNGKIIRIAERMESECGTPSKNFYIALCMNEQKFCEMAGDFIPEENFTPKGHKTKDIRKPTPLPEPKPKPASVKPKPEPKPIVQKVVEDAPPPKRVRKIQSSRRIVTIDIPSEVKTALDGNLHYILNNTCMFVSQSPAFIDANQELAIQCAHLWAQIKDVRPN